MHEMARCYLDRRGRRRGSGRCEALAPHHVCMRQILLATNAASWLADSPRASDKTSKPALQQSGRPVRRIPTGFLPQIIRYGEPGDAAENDAAENPLSDRRADRHQSVTPA